MKKGESTSCALEKKLPSPPSLKNGLVVFEGDEFWVFGVVFTIKVF